MSQGYYYVVSECWAGGKTTYILVDFQGTRYKCEKWIELRSRQGFHTATSAVTANPRLYAKRRGIPLKNF